MPDKNNISREEIRLYIEGRLTGKAAHKVERYLLENPFAQEAMEGFEGFDQHDLDQDLIHLEQRIHQRKQSRWPIYRVAASVALLLGSLVAIWYYIDLLPQDQMAYTADEHRLESSQLGPEESGAVLPPEVPPQKPQVKPEVKILTQPAEVETSTPVEEYEVLEVTPRSLADADVEIDALSDEILLSEADEDLSSQLQGAVAGVTLSKQNLIEEESSIEFDGAEKKGVRIRGASNLSTASVAVVGEGHLVKGEVTDDAGEPLPGVSIVIKGAGVGAISDIDGKYQIKAQSGDILQFSFIGFNLTEVRLDDREVINVELETDLQSLSEVVVVGYGTESVVENEAYKGAQPIIGMNEYRDYLKRELRYPLKAIENEVEGKVILKVTVQSNGSLGSIEVRRSLGFGCDEEAIRLIKSGPNWKPAERDGIPTESQVRIKVKFQLDE